MAQVTVDSLHADVTVVEKAPPLGEPSPRLGPTVRRSLALVMSQFAVATSNRSKRLSTGLASTMSLSLVPRFVFGAPCSTKASSVAAKTWVRAAGASGVVTVTAFERGDSRPAASIAVTS